MGKSAPSAPAPPDPAATAAAQTATNVETARTQAQLNRVNQVTPYGNLTYTQDPRADQWLNHQLAAERAAFDSSGGGASGGWVHLGEADGSIWDQTLRLGGSTTFDEGAVRQRLNASNPYRDLWTATQTLSPAEQAQLEASNRAIATYGRAANRQLEQAEAALSNPFNPTLPGYADFGTPGISRDQVEAAMTARLQPLQDRDRARLETNLANQGLTFGSEAYRAAMDDHNRGVNDQRLAVTAAGGAEQSRLQQLVQGARQASLAEQLQLRIQPINEASALLSGSQINLPSWVNVPQVGVAPTDYLGAVGQQQAGQNAAYQGQVATANSNAQGAASLASSAISAGASYYGGMQFGGGTKAPMGGGYGGLKN